MENAYGIGVKNRYELFYDEDVDPLEIIRQQEEEKERRKTDKAKDKNKSTKAAKQSSSSVPKKAKENAPTSVSKPTEVIEPLSKPRSRAFGEKNKNTSSFEDTKDNEERKNFRNREDQYFNPESSGTFTVRNSAYKRGNQESRDNRPDGEFRRGRGGFRGRGRGRGRGGFSNFEGRPRREFDRHSGSDKTGVRSTEKRDGGGANNWGDVKDDFKFSDKDASNNWDENRDDFEQTVEKKDPSAANDAWGEIPDDFESSTNAQPEVGEKSEEAGTENVESKENEPAVDADAIEEAVREMTLDEWKREQESKRSVPKYNLRKPGEGEDNSQWKKLYVLKKKIKDEDDDEEEEEEEDVSDEEYGRRGRHRQVVDIPINFSDSRRSRGRGRGGRGAGPRGGGGGGGAGGVGPGSGGGFPSGGPGSRDRGMSRGAPKIKPTPQSAPKVDDWNDFPSLVTA